MEQCLRLESVFGLKFFIIYNLYFLICILLIKIPTLIFLQEYSKETIR